MLSVVEEHRPGLGPVQIHLLGMEGRGVRARPRTPGLVTVSSATVSVTLWRGNSKCLKCNRVSEIVKCVYHSQALYIVG